MPKSVEVCLFYSIFVFFFVRIEGNPPCSTTQELTASFTTSEKYSMISLKVSREMNQSVSAVTPWTVPCIFGLIFGFFLDRMNYHRKRSKLLANFNMFSEKNEQFSTEK